MKKIKILLLCVVLISCSNGKHHNKYVKDREGNVYRLVHRIGFSYWVQEINTTEIDSLISK